MAKNKTFINIKFGRKQTMIKKADAIVRGRYKLNPISLKFITILIAGLHQNDEPNTLYRFRVRDFKELLKLKRKDLHFALKESIKELLEKPLYIPKPNINIKNYKDDNSFLMLNWLASAEYIEKEGVIEFEISNKLRPYLLEAKKKFLRYRLENILNLRSVYIIRLYELLKDNLEINLRYGKKKGEETYSIEEFIEMLEIPRSYQYSSHIKKLILEKAKQEFEKHTDIIFTYEEIKTGRKITHIKFFIYKNPKNYKEEKPLPKQIQKEELNSPKKEVPKTTTTTWNDWRKKLLNKGNVIISFSDKIFEVKNGYLFKDKKLLSSEKSFEVWQELYENRDKLKIMSEDEYLQEQIKKAEEQEKNYINQLKTKYKNLIVKFDNGENKEATLLDIKFEDKIFKIYFQIEDKIYTQKFGKIDDVEYVLEQANYLYEVEQKRKSREKSIAILDNLNIKKF